MKNIIIKSLMFAGVCALTLSGCTEDYPDRTPSPVPTADCIGAYFPNTDEGTIEVPQSVNSVTLTITRAKTTSAASVALKKVDKYGVFTVPATVEFAAGKADATIEVSFKDLTPFVQYPVAITMDDAAINPYVVNNNGTTNFLLNITQADWKDYATGTYTSAFFGQSWDQTLQYSKTLNEYRLPDLFASGVNYLFSWDGGATIVPGGTLASTGLYVQSSGYVDSQYGLVQTNTSASASGYDSATKTFTFNIKWTVTAGSFGVTDETYVLK